MPKTWTVELVEDPETKELLLKFPEDVIKELEWEEGTVLCWQITTDNKLMLKKAVDEDSEEYGL
jgi:hypothetical protein